MEGENGELEFSQFLVPCCGHTPDRKQKGADACLTHGFGEIAAWHSRETKAKWLHL